MFSIYCKDRHEGLELLKKLPQINIKSVLMINLVKNKTGQYERDKKYLINMLCEIKIQVDYMVKAISEKVAGDNPIQYYYCNYYNEVDN